MSLVIPFFVLMASVMGPSPSRQEDSSPSELASPLLEAPLKEEIIEPFLLEGDKGEEEDYLQEGLQDAFERGTQDVFMPKKEKK